ncbi:MAG: hypothetical protein AB1651_12425 [Pseudomonadota bacterium]
MTNSRDQCRHTLELIEDAIEQADLRKELRTGLSAVEHRLGRVETNLSELHTDYAALSVRIDQVQADTRTLKTRTETAI